MRLITGLLFFTIITTFSLKTIQSQDTQIVDSLKNMIDITPADDTLKPKYINDLVWRIKFSDPDTSLILLDQSEELSKILDFADGLGNSYNSRAVIYTVQGKFDSALTYYNLAIAQFERINDPHGLAFCVGNIGTLYNFQSNFDSSMFYNLKALKIRKDNRLDKEVAKSNINIGVIYFDKGYYETSLKYYLDALGFYENMPGKTDVDYSYLGAVYNNVGNVYQELEKLGKAKYYYEKGLGIFTKYGDNREIATLYNNMGDIAKAGNKPEKALSDYRESYSLSKQIDEKQICLISRAGLAQHFVDMKVYDSARFYIDEGLKYGKEINDKKHTIRLYISLGRIATQNNDPYMALRYFRNATEISEGAGVIKFKPEIDLAISEIYDKLDDKAKAFYYYKLYAAAKDSILNEEKHRQITDMETKYQSAQKNREIALQNLEIEKKQVQINHEKARQRLFLAGLAILALVLAFVVVYFIQKRKHRDELHHRRLEDQKQKEQLKAIKQSLEAGEQERIRLADQLHDDVAPLLIGLRNSIADIGKKFPDVPVFQKITKNISIVHSEVRNISHVLYPFSVSGESFTDSLNNYLRNFEHANNLKVINSISDINKINQIPPDIQNFIYRTVQELLNNVVKHAGASEISLKINQKNEILSLNISDNGKGIVETEKNDGIGLRRIKRGLKVFDGKMIIDNLKTQGTEIRIEIAVSDNIMI